MKEKEGEGEKRERQTDRTSTPNSVYSHEHLKLKRHNADAKIKLLKFHPRNAVFVCLFSWNKTLPSLYSGERNERLMKAPFFQKSSLSVHSKED